MVEANFGHESRELVAWRGDEVVGRDTLYVEAFRKQGGGPTDVRGVISPTHKLVVSERTERLSRLDDITICHQKIANDTAVQMLNSLAIPVDDK